MNFMMTLTSQVSIEKFMREGEKEKFMLIL